MGQKSKDETRWLGRLLTVIPVMLVIRILSVMAQRFSEGSLSLLTAVLSLGVSVFLFWIGYRLLMCSSLWNMFNWMPEPLPLFLYLQCQYFRINKHVRAGLVGGVAFLITECLSYLMYRFHRDTGFYEWLRRLWHSVFWPQRDWIELLNFSLWPILAQFLFVIFYLFMMGFIIGFLISYLTERIRQPGSGRKSDGLEV